MCGHWYISVWLLVTFVLSFKAGLLCHLCRMDSSDSLLVWVLLTSTWDGQHCGQAFWSTYFSKHCWDSNPCHNMRYSVWANPAPVIFFINLSNSGRKSKFVSNYTNFIASAYEYLPYRWVIALSVVRFSNKTGLSYWWHIWPSVPEVVLTKRHFLLKPKELLFYFWKA